MNARWHVAIGGGIGALIRGALVLAALAVADRAELVVVLALNVLGAFALGWLVARARHDVRWRRLLPLVGTGFLGALTTFSALAVHVGGALLARAWVLAVGVAVLHLGVGLAAVLAGFRMGGRGAGSGSNTGPGGGSGSNGGRGVGSGPTDGEVAP